MSYLARTLSAFFGPAGMDATAIETAAGMPSGTISKFKKGVLPRVGSLGRFLENLPDPVACQVLRSSLLDHTPDAWTPRTHINIEPASSLAEAPPPEPQTTDQKFAITMRWIEEESKRNTFLVATLNGFYNVAHGISH